MSFEFWLQRELVARNLDAAIFSEYILTNLKAGEYNNIEEILQSYILDEQDCALFTATIRSQYNMYLLTSNSSRMSGSKLSANASEFRLPPSFDNFKNHPPIPSNGNKLENIMDAGSMCPSHENTAPQVLADVPENHENLNQAIKFASGDWGNDESEYCEWDIHDLDWISLGDEVEATLREYSPASTYSTDVIIHSLHLNNCGVIPTVDHILTAEAKTMACRPCRHLLTGRCMRNDCYFDHKFDDIPCRYWLSSSCLQESCPFLHDLSNIIPLQFVICPPIPAPNLDTTPKEMNLISEEAFPSLSSTINQPTLTASFSFTKKTKTAKGGKSYDEVVKTKPRSPSTAKGGATSKIGESNICGPLKKLETLMPQDWVLSGSAIATEYASFRAEARTLAISRNKLLEEATKAYLAGSKDIARKLSVQGQVMNSKMKACHKEAAKRIFSQRNPESQLAKGTLDLHGLHVAEAVACLSEILPALKQASMKHASLITGSGHHSAGPQGDARLLPSIQKYLETEGYSFGNIVDNNGYTGGLKVTL